MTRILACLVLAAGVMMEAPARADSPVSSRERRTGDQSGGEDDRNLLGSIFAIPAVALAAASVLALAGSAGITAVLQADQSVVLTSLAQAQRDQVVARTPVDLHLLALFLVAAALVCGTGAIVLTVLNFVWPLKLADINRFFNRAR